MPVPLRSNPRTWDQIAETSPRYDIYFQEYNDILSEIGATQADALARMRQLYEDAITTYSDDYILVIFHLNLVANGKKYEELLYLYENDIDIFSPYHITEDYTTTRTPDLQAQSQSYGSGSNELTRRQSRTETTTPATSTTTTHQTNPYDNTGLRIESQDQTAASGTETMVESFSGSPDLTTTSSSATTTTTSTGTDTVEHHLIRSGRDGKFSISEIIEQAELSADKLDILDIIINDLANQIFIQVWD